jgi:hypothetical protein
MHPFCGLQGSKVEDLVAAVMSPSFEMLEGQDVPRLSWRDARRYSLDIFYVSVWKLRDERGP